MWLTHKQKPCIIRNVGIVRYNGAKNLVWGRSEDMKIRVRSRHKVAGDEKRWFLFNAEGTGFTLI